jgi:hypothetical protein
MLSRPNLSLAETRPGGGQISYELGKPNWEARVIPDIRRPGRATVVDEPRMIDVITLGDRFTGAALLALGDPTDHTNQRVTWYARWRDTRRCQSPRRSRVATYQISSFPL